MTSRRPRRLIATATVVLFGASGAPAALADPDATPDRAGASAARDPGAAVAGQRQRRVEDAWLAEQVRAAAAERRRPR